MGTSLLDEQEETIFLFDDRFVPMIEEKLTIFSEYGDLAMVHLTDQEGDLTAVYWRLFQVLATEYPEIATCDQTGFQTKMLGLSLARDGQLDFDPATAVFPDLGRRCADLLQTLHGVRRLGGMLALSTQEDHVIMRNLTGGDNEDAAEALFVALPTHWNPLDQLGLSFHQIHAHIGDNERLLKAAPRLMKAIIQKGPFFRYNWLLVSLPVLCQNPAILEGQVLTEPDLNTVSSPRNLLEQLYFRSERQTLINYPDLNRGLFFIRIYQRPLLDALVTPELALHLAKAVESTNPAQLAYREMAGMREPLLTGLRELAHELS